jgi:anti-sigma regulatory factor (Ser/Thr protein kinase)
MLELALAARPSALAEMANAVETHAVAAGVPPERAILLVVALDEILTNVIAHGRLGADDIIAVTVEVRGDTLAATVEDPGPAFDPLQEAPQPVLDGSVEDRPVGGLGLHIVKTVARRITYERRQGRNRLMMEVAP